MERFNLLRHVAGILESMGLRYFVTGSSATIVYGEPRMTNDIDIVVDLPEHRVAALCKHFLNDHYYISEEAAHEAVRRKSQFNIIHHESGLKVDFMIPADTRFNESRFERAKSLRAGTDFDAFFASPEDVIIKKMEYYREGRSEKHLRDIAGVLKGEEEIDVAYIATWAEKMGLSEIWGTIQLRMKE